MGTRIVHRLEYLTRQGEVTTEAADNHRREEIVRYAALVTQVELLTGGELMQGCTRRLKQGGVVLKMKIEEQVRFSRSLMHCLTCTAFLEPPRAGLPAQTSPPARAEILAGPETYRPKRPQNMRWRLRL